MVVCVRGWEKKWGDLGGLVARTVFRVRGGGMQRARDGGAYLRVRVRMGDRARTGDLDLDFFDLVFLGFMDFVFFLPFFALTLMQG